MEILVGLTFLGKFESKRALSISKIRIGGIYSLRLLFVTSFIGRSAPSNTIMGNIAFCSKRLIKSIQ